MAKKQLGEVKEGKEFWNWPTYHRFVEGVDWKDAKVLTAGVDVGSVSSKAVIMADGKIYSWSIMRTGSNSPDSAKNVLGWALEDTGIKLKDFHYIVGTGYGRVNVPMANKAITEIACHGMGAHYIWGPTTRTVLDVGGQDVKAIKIDEKGRITQFLMNDKCAAGTGRGMEVFADLLKIHIRDVGAVSLTVDEEPPPTSSVCVVFAKSEAVALLRKGWPREKVLAAYTRGMAIRMFELLEKAGIEPEFVITGGQSKNIGTVKRVERLLNRERLPVSPDWEKNGLDPMAAGAIGAAIFAKALYLRSQKR